MNYDYIAKAIHHYTNLGYKYIEVPWFVSREAMVVTSPPNARFVSGFLGDFVASGEQSFIQMFLDSKLSKGRYQTVTPCFRDDIIDEWHLNYFMKLELIEVSPDKFSLNKMIQDAKYFFDFYLKTEIIDTDIGKDIIAKGIELGSYGYRNYKDFSWCYGTGLAEPRLSQVIKK